MASCNFPLKQIIEPSAQYCQFPCPPGAFLYWNGTCKSSCLFPFRSKNELDYLFCLNDCPSGFLYWDGRCGSSCPFPLREYNYSYDRYCSNDCGNDYLFWDASCKSSCDPPYTSIINSSLKFCSNNSCPSSYYLYWNGSCLPTCNSPFNSSQEEISQKVYCNIPCPGLFLHENGSCVEECKYPFLITENFGAKFCNYICPTGYLYTNGSCLTNCDPPFQKGGELSRLTCYSDCVVGFLYENGSCSNDCLAPYIIHMSYPYRLCINACTKPFIVYDANGGKCSECLNNSHCSEQSPICSVEFGSCLSCIRELNCSLTPNVTIYPLRHGIFLIEYDLDMNNTLQDIITFLNISLSISEKNAYNLTYSSLSLRTYGVQIVPLLKMPAQNITFEFLFPEIFRSFENISMPYSKFEFELEELELTCSDSCKSCSQALTCDLCFDSYTLINNTCKKIIRNLPTLEARQGFSLPNVIFLTFSDPMNMMLYEFSNITKLIFADPSLNVTYYFEKIDEKNYKINLVNVDDVPSQNLVIQFKNTSIMRSYNGLEYPYPQISLKIQAIPSPEALKTIQVTTEYINQGSSALFFLTLNPTLLWLIMNNLQSYYYLMFYNVELPYNVKSIMSLFKIARLDFISSDMIGLDLNMNISQIPSPEKFAEQEIDSYYFKSGISPIYSILGLWALFITLSSLNHYLRNIPTLIRALLVKVVRMFQDSFFLNMWLGFYLDQTIVATLQLKNATFDAEDQGLSLMLAFMSYALNFTLIFYIRKFSRTRYDDLEGNMVTTLVAEFRKPQRAIFTLELIKKFSIGNVIVLFYDYPMIQIWLNAGLYLAFAIICIKTRPKGDKLKNFLYIFNDLMLFSASLMIFIIHVLNKVDSDLDLKNKLGWMLIWLAASNLIVILLANLQFDKVILFFDEKFNTKRLLKKKRETKLKKKRIIRPKSYKFRNK